MDQARTTWLMTQVRDAARTHILPRFRALGPHEVQSKTAPDDLVTAADLACEAALSDAIRRDWPGALVVGEEAVASDPGLLDRIGTAETCVILDPVDGTWNFANGLATFGVIVAVTRFGVPVWGGLYDPLMDDWITAGAGEGTQLLTVAQPRAVSCGSSGEALTGYLPLFLFDKALQPRIAAAFPLFHRVTSLRCSCHEYRLLAQGRVDFVLCAGLKPWDHAAGVLAVQEAGGTARLLDGRDYAATIREGVLLSARDDAAWDRVAEVLSFLA